MAVLQGDWVWYREKRAIFGLFFILGDPGQSLLARIKAARQTAAGECAPLNTRIKR